MGQPALRKKSWALTKEPSRAIDHEWQNPSSAKSVRRILFLFLFYVTVYTTLCLREGRSDGDQRTRRRWSAQSNENCVLGIIARLRFKGARRRSSCLALIDNFTAWRQRWTRGTYFGHAVIRAGLRWRCCYSREPSSVGGLAVRP
jgi:hypothetical protein